MLTLSIITVYLIVVGTWIYVELKHAPKAFEDNYNFPTQETETEVE